ncbi:MAG: condensation domain-containing protein [Christensenellales bacterium]|jgi:NRPS condensation-like uncharacterized protein|nr:DUF1298 domain-containing protein [Clostridiales bacterium]
MKYYKAELWDKMQHIMERYNDHMVHCHLEFDNALDYEALKKAVNSAIELVPILKCRFTHNFFKAKWAENRNFNIEDTISFEECADKAKQNKLIEEFLTAKLDERHCQIKALLTRFKGKDTLNLVINHMVMDGADLKLFINLIAECYTDIRKGGQGKVKFKNGRRDEGQIFEDMDKKQRLKAKTLISYSKACKSKITFPFEKGSGEIKPLIVKRVIPQSVFLAAKQECKRVGCTINDLIVACFYRAALKLIDIKEGEALGVPCMVDLRKYIKSGQSAGVTNLTSMVICNIGEDIGKDIFDTVAKVKKEMDRLKSDYPGLRGLPLLRLAFRIFPYCLAKLIIGTFFKNPLLGISNIGIIKEEGLSFDGIAPSYVFYTGSIKYAPYYQLALTTYKNQITLTTALYGSQKDKLNAEILLNYVAEEFKEFCQNQAKLNLKKLDLPNKLYYNDYTLSI